MSLTRPFSNLAMCGLISLTLQLISCSNDQAASATTLGAGGTTVSTVEVPTLRFIVDDPTQTQALFPGDIKEFQVEVMPHDEYRVRFSIVPLEQIPHDASLDRTDADTDENGLASVTLRAPSIATVFELKAAIGSTSSTSLTIGVQAKGEAELQVVPEYDGNRPITGWVANAYMSTLCSELPQKVMTERGLPADSMFSASSVFGIAPRIKQLRVEPFMAVTLRAGHYVYGCSNVDQPLNNELNTVRVSVADRPIALSGVDLDLSFGISQTTDAWQAHLQLAAEDVMRNFTGSSENDPRLVLDTMASLLPETSLDQFESLRAAGTWDLIALSSLASMDGLLLRRRLAGWLETGSQALGVDDAWRGRVVALENSEQSAELRLVEVAGIDAETAGFVPTVEATWTADPSDTLALGATLSWAPGQLVTALATQEALVDFPQAQDLRGALAELFDCEALANGIVPDGSDEPDLECDRDCMEMLCADALTTLSTRLVESDVEQRLQLSATGQAGVDDESRLLSLIGSWRGTFPAGQSAAVGGSVSGYRSEGGQQ